MPIKKAGCNYNSRLFYYCPLDIVNHNCIFVKFNGNLSIYSLNSNDQKNASNTTASNHFTCVKFSFFLHLSWENSFY